MERIKELVQEVMALQKDDGSNTAPWLSPPTAAAFMQVRAMEENTKALERIADALEKMLAPKTTIEDVSPELAAALRTGGVGEIRSVQFDMPNAGGEPVGMSQAVSNQQNYGKKNNRR